MHPAISNAQLRKPDATAVHADQKANELCQPLRAARTLPAEPDPKEKYGREIGEKFKLLPPLLPLPLALSRLRPIPLVAAQPVSWLPKAFVLTRTKDGERHFKASFAAAKRRHVPAGYLPLYG